MKAFLNDPKIKDKYLSRLVSHYKHDEIIKGRYWENGKGCAVGCTIHSGAHGCYESELGIPEWVARLEDTLFEGMPNEKAKEFPLKLLKAIPVGFENWSHLYHQICIFILKDVCKDTTHELVKQPICDIIELHMNEHKYDAAGSAAWSAARSAARSAAESAWSAAESAAESAWSAAESAAGSAAESAAWSAAWSAARSAAWSAAESAAESAWSAWSAAESAAESAARSAAESAAGSAAGSAAHYKISEKLIDLLEIEK